MPKRQRNYNPYEKKLQIRELEPVIAEPLQVSLSEVNGDFKKLLKKFLKKCRKEEVLKPYFEKMYYKSKGQKKREKYFRAVYEQKKLIKNEES